MKSLKIDVVCMDGSPLGVTYKTIFGDGAQIGLGGAELALLTMCDVWTKAGHTVTLYNNPREFGVSPFEQKSLIDYNPNSNRDIIINFRSPNPLSIVSKGLKIWWSCDPYTRGDYRSFAPMMDKIICISSYHKGHFQRTYGINNAQVIDLPVRVQDYAGLNIKKIPNRLIFSSIPDRGLDGLLIMWDKLCEAIPDISLVITSDYRLWSAEAGALNERHRIRWLSKSKVQFLGAVPRSKLIEEELRAEIFAYPSIFEELFCISCSEAQYAGAYPITSGIGALETTNMGTIIPGNAHNGAFYGIMSECIIDLLKDREQLYTLQKEIKQKALDRFHPDVILKQWEEIFKDAI